MSIFLRSFGYAWIVISGIHFVWTLAFLKKLHVDYPVLLLVPILGGGLGAALLYFEYRWRISDLAQHGISVSARYLMGVSGLWFVGCTVSYVFVVLVGFNEPSGTGNPGVGLGWGYFVIFTPIIVLAAGFLGFLTFAWSCIFSAQRNRRARQISKRQA